MRCYPGIGGAWRDVMSRDKLKQTDITYQAATNNQSNHEKTRHKDDYYWLKCIRFPFINVENIRAFSKYSNQHFYVKDRQQRIKPIQCPMYVSIALLRQNHIRYRGSISRNHDTSADGFALAPR